MKQFLTKTFSFALFSSVLVYFFLQLFASRESEKRGYLSSVNENTVIVMGDSKSLVALDKEAFEQNMPGWKVVNLSLWARNPKYSYHTFKDLLVLQDSVVLVYHLTYRHLCNRQDEVPQFKYGMKVELNKFLDKVKYEPQGFAFLQGAFLSHQPKSKASDFLATLDSAYYDDFQFHYVDSIAQLAAFNNNLFFTTEFPHQRSIDSLYNRFNNYHKYREKIDSLFPQHIDLRHVDGMPNEYWHDREHLNKEGRVFFTMLFTDSLKSRLAEEE
jgi:hypothetical protein